MTLHIDHDICLKEPNCPAALSCSTQALFYDPSDEKLFFNADRCNGCGLCVQKCAYRALSLFETTADLKAYLKKINEVRNDFQTKLEALLRLK